LLSGSVAVGALPSDLDGGTLITTTLAAAVPSSGPIARAVERIYSRTPVRATVGRTNSPPDRQGIDPEAALVGVAPAERELAEVTEKVSVLIEHPAYREARVAFEVREEPILASVKAVPTLLQRAGLSILAYALSARGMPSWSTWSAQGVGLGVWFESRRMRHERYQTTGDDGGSNLEDQVRILRLALEAHDPRSVLLMLELSSCYYEVGKYDLAIKYLLLAAQESPEFPEVWLRLSLAYCRLSAALRSPTFRFSTEPTEGDSVDPETATTLNHLWDRVSIELGAKSVSYRQWARRELLRRADGEVALGWKPLDPFRYIGSRIGDPGVLRRHERIAKAVASAGAARGPNGHVVEWEGADDTDLDIEQDVVDAQLIAHFGYLAIACAEECQRRLLRGRLIGRCLFVQSQRIYFWNLLVSRFGVRKLNTAARSAELLCRVHAMSQTLGSEGVASNERAVRNRLDDAYRVVNREGTGWRSLWYLAEAYDIVRTDLSDRGLSRLTAEQLRDRVGQLRNDGERRCRGERAWDPRWLERQPADQAAGAT
jgi:hypothetical protein